MAGARQSGRRIDRCQKLGQALIGEAIAAKTSIALGSCADPGMGLCSVGGLLPESPEMSVGISLPLTS